MAYDLAQYDITQAPSRHQQLQQEGRLDNLQATSTRKLRREGLQDNLALHGGHDFIHGSQTEEAWKEKIALDQDELNKAEHAVSHARQQAAALRKRGKEQQAASEDSIAARAAKSLAAIKKNMEVDEAAYHDESFGSAAHYAKREKVGTYGVQKEGSEQDEDEDEDKAPQMTKSALGGSLCILFVSGHSQQAIYPLTPHFR